MLEWLVPFLEEFKEGSKRLEGDNLTQPTLPFVLLVPLFCGTTARTSYTTTPA